MRGENSTFFIIYYLLSKKGTPFRMCLCVSKNLPLGDRLPRYGGGGACARGGAVARRAGGREPRLCPKPSCLREVLSPTACGRSPLPEGAKEFFDNLRHILSDVPQT